MIKIKRAKNGQLYFLIIAANYKVLHTSETYKSRQGLVKGIKSTAKVFGAKYEDLKIKDETKN